MSVPTGLTGARRDRFQARIDRLDSLLPLAGRRARLSDPPVPPRTEYNILVHGVQTPVLRTPRANEADATSKEVTASLVDSSAPSNSHRTTAVMQQLPSSTSVSTHSDVSSHSTKLVPPTTTASISHTRGRVGPSSSSHDVYDRMISADERSADGDVSDDDLSTAASGALTLSERSDAFLLHAARDQEEFDLQRQFSMPSNGPTKSSSTTQRTAAASRGPRQFVPARARAEYDSDEDVHDRLSARRMRPSHSGKSSLDSSPLASRARAPSAPTPPSALAHSSTLAGSSPITGTGTSSHARTSPAAPFLVSSPSTSAAGSPWLASNDIDLFGNFPRPAARFASPGQSPAQTPAARLHLPSGGAGGGSPQSSAAAVSSNLRPPPPSSAAASLQRRSVSEPNAATADWTGSGSNRQSPAPSPAPVDLFGSSYLPPLPHTHARGAVPAAATLGLAPPASSSSSSSIDRLDSKPSSARSSPRTDPTTWQHLMHDVRTATPPFQSAVPLAARHLDEMLQQGRARQQRAPHSAPNEATTTVDAGNESEAEVAALVAARAPMPPMNELPTTPDPPTPTGFWAHPMAAWSVSDVSSFLRSLGDAFAPYVSLFSANYIDGRQLVVIDDADLLALGVDGTPQARLHRKALLRARGERAVADAVREASDAERRHVWREALNARPRPSSPPTPPSPPTPSMPEGVSILRASCLSGITRLGCGNFGITFRALWRDARWPASRSSIDVAVKVPRARSGTDEWNELIAFMEVPPHPHVLPLLGICTDFPKRLLLTSEEEQGDATAADESADTKKKKKSTHPPQTCCFVTTYMARGSLKDVLSSTELAMQLLGGDVCDARLHAAPRGSAEWRVLSLALHASTRLLHDVAEGLSHLHAHGILHRDIATRNVLISASGEALIADFGLARKVNSNTSSNTDDDTTGSVRDPLGMPHRDIGPSTAGASSGYYRLAHPEQTALPLRWMAPESLAEFVHSCASDAWMFGVCAWEVLTRAEHIPYHDLGTYNQLLARVGGGARTLQLPTFVPARLAGLINRCWRFEPNARPTMREVANELREILRDQANELGIELAPRHAVGRNSEETTPTRSSGHAASPPAAAATPTAATSSTLHTAPPKPVIAPSAAASTSSVSPPSGSAASSSPSFSSISPTALVARGHAMFSPTRTFGSVTSVSSHEVASPRGLHARDLVTEVHSSLSTGVGYKHDVVKHHEVHHRSTTREPIADAHIQRRSDAFGHTPTQRPSTATSSRAPRATQIEPYDLILMGANDLRSDEVDSSAPSTALARVHPLLANAALRLPRTQE